MIFIIILDNGKIVQVKIQKNPTRHSKEKSLNLTEEYYSNFMNQNQQGQNQGNIYNIKNSNKSTIERMEFNNNNKNKNKNIRLIEDEIIENENEERENQPILKKGKEYENDERNLKRSKIKEKTNKEIQRKRNLTENYTYHNYKTSNSQDKSKILLSKHNYSNLPFESAFENNKEYLTEKDLLIEDLNLKAGFLNTENNLVNNSSLNKKNESLRNKLQKKPYSKILNLEKYIKCKSNNSINNNINSTKNINNNNINPSNNTNNNPNRKNFQTITQGNNTNTINTNSNSKNTIQNTLESSNNNVNFNNNNNNNNHNYNNNYNSNNNNNNFKTIQAEKATNKNKQILNFENYVKKKPSNESHNSNNNNMKNRFKTISHDNNENKENKNLNNKKEISKATNKNPPINNYNFSTINDSKNSYNKDEVFRSLVLKTKESEKENLVKFETITNKSINLNKRVKSIEDSEYNRRFNKEKKEFYPDPIDYNNNNIVRQRNNTISNKEDFGDKNITFYQNDSIANINVNTNPEKEFNFNNIDINVKDEGEGNEYNNNNNIYTSTSMNFERNNNNNKHRHKKTKSQDFLIKIKNDNILGNTNENYNKNMQTIDNSNNYNSIKINKINNNNNINNNIDNFKTINVNKSSKIQTNQQLINNQNPNKINQNNLQSSNNNNNFKANYYTNYSNFSNNNNNNIKNQNYQDNIYNTEDNQRENTARFNSKEKNFQDNYTNLEENPYSKSLQIEKKIKDFFRKNPIKLEKDSYYYQNKNQIALEYIPEIYSNYLIEELNSENTYGYLTYQTDINEQMRAILIDWLTEVHSKFNMNEVTLFLCVNILDRFLNKDYVKRGQLQLVGVASMLIACKQEEIYSPLIDDFVFITDNAYSKKQINDMEKEILMKLKFEVFIPNPLRIFEIISMAFNFSRIQYNFGVYLMQVYLIDYRMTKFLPSVIACTAAYVMMKYFNIENYNLIYSKWNVNGGGASVIKECAREICYLIDNLEKSSLQAAKRKFATEQFDSVSLINFS